MARKKARKKTKSGVEMDMTPMIDIVFLLIIFFMVVTELTLDQALVILPIASEAKIEEPQPGSRIVVINVSIDVDGETEIIQIANGDPLTPEGLERELRAETQAFGRWEPNPSDPTKNDSALEVTIRCDQGARSENIHKIFAACQKARIYKVRCAALNDRVEDPYSSN
ncbi:MAG TPA: biopolymer transporter ExbD [Planctomycetes bacterium]|nr:biopolymer transporter ExbD [Planctomycetota bacterium]HIN80905.1 biopolymer transporter ExbD [Planctomycetota bacterium]